MAKSMFNLSDFKASIKSNGVARDTRFEVVLFPPQQLMLNTKELSIRCHTASMPAFNVKTRDYIIGQGQIRKMPVNFDNGNVIELSFYNNYKGTIYSDLVEWAKHVAPFTNTDGHVIRFVSEIYGKILIQQLDEQDNIRQGWELRDAYIVSVDAVPLDSGHVDKVQLVKIHVAYRYAITTRDIQTLESTQLSETVFRDKNNPYISGENERRKISTAKGNYSKRRRSYIGVDSDPTMVSIVKDSGKGGGLTPDQFYAYVTEFVSTTRIKGVGLFNNQQAEWFLYDLPEIENVIGTGDRILINEKFEVLSSNYYNIERDVNSFFGDTSSCLRDFYSIKDSLQDDDQLFSDIFSLQTIYNDVFTKQLDINNSFSEISDIVDSFNQSDISFTLT